MQHNKFIVIEGAAASVNYSQALATLRNMAAYTQFGYGSFPSAAQVGAVLLIIIIINFN